MLMLGGDGTAGGIKNDGGQDSGGGLNLYLGTNSGGSVSDGGDGSGGGYRK